VKYLPIEPSSKFRMSSIYTTKNGDMTLQMLKIKRVTRRVSSIFIFQRIRFLHKNKCIRNAFLARELIEKTVVKITFIGQDHQLNKRKMPIKS